MLLAVAGPFFPLEVIDMKIRNASGNTTKGGKIGGGGFTLLEILIVIVLLAVVSLSVIPKLTGGAGNDDTTLLVNQLQILRSQLELYQQQHDGEYPCGKVEKAVDPDEFVKRLTITTRINHEADGMYGPYLYEFPRNPFNGKNTLRYIRGDQASGIGQAGWAFNLDTGKIQADDDRLTLNGKLRHSDL